MSGKAIRISSEAHKTMIGHAEAAHPEEACGLLLGSEGAIIEARPADNISRAPETQFEIDPAALFSAMRAERAGGPALLGYYHSHPSGAAEPSATDARRALPDGKLWMVIADGLAAGWISGEAGLHDRFRPICLHIAD
jgi:proteasome lid subunit RPN8/RPN11